MLAFMLEFAFSLLRKNDFMQSCTSYLIIHLRLLYSGFYARHNLWRATHSLFSYEKKKSDEKKMNVSMTKKWDP